MALGLSLCVLLSLEVSQLISWLADQAVSQSVL